jgi:hypothetical protein
MKNKNPGFLNLINNKLLRGIIKFAPIGSLIIANFFVLVIFSHFFNLPLNNWIFWVIFLVGFLFSLITVRTNYILHWKSKEKQKENKLEEPVKTPKIGMLNSLILLIKNLFFNILNDLFILTIIWTVIFAVPYLFGLINAPQNFINFATIITLMGVLSGFFQFYIKNYKEQVSMKIAKSVSQYISGIIKKISFSDFLKNLDKGDKEKIQKIFSGKNNTQWQMAGFRDKNVTFINMPFQVKDTSTFDNIDYLIEENMVKDVDINFDKLNNLYEIYFKNKFNKFKEEIDEKDLIEVRKLLFSHLIFFDEVLADLEKINLEFDPQEDSEKPKGFREHYEKFSYNCVYYMLDLMLNFKEEK